MLWPHPQDWTGDGQAMLQPDSKNQSKEKTHFMPGSRARMKSFKAIELSSSSSRTSSTSPFPPIGLPVDVPLLSGSMSVNVPPSPLPNHAPLGWRLL